MFWMLKSEYKINCKPRNNFSAAIWQFTRKYQIINPKKYYEMSLKPTASKTQHMRSNPEWKRERGGKGKKRMEMEHSTHEGVEINPV